MIAADLPAVTLDIRGDRLRFLLADAISECNIQADLGQYDKGTSLKALLTAAAAAIAVEPEPEPEE